jgi:hypothetical protein
MQSKPYYSSEVDVRREALRLYNTEFLNDNCGLNSRNEMIKGLVLFPSLNRTPSCFELSVQWL